MFNYCFPLLVTPRPGRTSGYSNKNDRHNNKHARKYSQRGLVEDSTSHHVQNMSDLGELNNYILQ